MAGFRVSLAVVLLLLLVPRASSQGFSLVPEGEGEEDPLVAMRSLARAKGRAEKTTPKELTPATLEAGRLWLRDYLGKVLEGLEVFYSVPLGIGGQLSEMEREMYAQDPAALALSMERYWFQAMKLEKIQKERVKAQKEPPHSSWAAVVYRLRAEMAWAKARPGMGKWSVLPELVLDGWGTEDHLKDCQWYARVKKQATSASQKQLAAQLGTATRNAAERLFERVLGGVELYHHLSWERHQDWLKTESNLRGEPGEDYFFENYWRFTKLMLDFSLNRLPVGKDVEYQDQEARYHHLSAALGARRVNRDKTALHLAPLILHLEAEEILPGPWSVEVAKARWALNHQSVKELAVARRDVAANKLEERRERIFYGIDLDNNGIARWSARLLEAERALSANQDHQLRAFAAHWQLAWELEALARSRYFKRQKEPPDHYWLSNYWLAKYRRLEAELKWAKARAAGLGK